MSNLYFNEESDYSEENTCGNKFFHSTILQPFQFNPEQKNHEKETMKKKLNIFTHPLLIYYILEKEISAGTNADIAKTKREK